MASAGRGSAWGGARIASVSMSAEYGSMVCVHRSAGELITRARGAKQASMRASTSASLTPFASSGRCPSSPGQSPFWPAEACLTSSSGMVGRGRRPLISSASSG
jgi:hypothetical protein